MSETATAPATPEQAIARVESSVPVTLADSGVVQLHNLDEALRFCKWAVESGLLPNGITKVAQAFVILQKGAELGFSPMASFEFIYPVNGRPRLAPAGALAKVKSSGLLADYDERTDGEGDTLRAVVTALRRGTQRPVVSTFTWADAKKAGLVGKDNWQKWPKRMLLARARGFCLQDAFPDLLGGLQVRETFDLDPGEVIVPEHGPMPPVLRSVPATPDPLLADEPVVKVAVPVERIPTDPAGLSFEECPDCGQPHRPSAACPEEV